MEWTEPDTCPKCDSGKLTLQGRSADGVPIHEMICRSCSHTWTVEVPVRGLVSP